MTKTKGRKKPAGTRKLTRKKSKTNTKTRRPTRRPGVQGGQPVQWERLALMIVIAVALAITITVRGAESLTSDTKIKGSMEVEHVVSSERKRTVDVAATLNATVTSTAVDNRR